MRKAYDSLADLVRVDLGLDPFQGDVFVFVGKDRTRAKVLGAQRLLAVRQAAGGVPLPAAANATEARPPTAQLVALLEEALPRHRALPGKGGAGSAS